MAQVCHTIEVYKAVAESGGKRMLLTTWCHAFPQGRPMQHKLTDPSLQHSNDLFTLNKENTTSFNLDNEVFEYLKSASGTEMERS